MLYKEITEIERKKNILMVKNKKNRERTRKTNVGENMSFFSVCIMCIKKRRKSSPGPGEAKNTNHIFNF